VLVYDSRRSNPFAEMFLMEVRSGATPHDQDIMEEGLVVWRFSPTGYGSQNEGLSIVPRDPVTTEPRSNRAFPSAISDFRKLPFSDGATSSGDFRVSQVLADVSRVTVEFRSAPPSSVLF
jgi:hypothetical protein